MLLIKTSLFLCFVYSSHLEKDKLFQFPRKEDSCSVKQYFDNGFESKLKFALFILSSFLIIATKKRETLQVSKEGGQLLYERMTLNKIFFLPSISLFLFIRHKKDQALQVSKKRGQLLCKTILC